VLQQHGYEAKKVLVCNAPTHPVKVVEGPPVVVEAPQHAPVEVAPPK